MPVSSPAPVFPLAIAHRGLHDVQAGRIENSMAAFIAAVEADCAVECDIQPARDATPMVFHDDTLDRLTGETGRVADRDPGDLRRIRLTGAVGDHGTNLSNGGNSDSNSCIPTLDRLLVTIAGATPVIIEVKSNWKTPDPAFMAAIARDVRNARGAVALKSFDPAIIAALAKLCPDIPLGLVARRFDRLDAKTETLPFEPTRAADLSNLSALAQVGASFVSYRVADLPTPITRHVRETLGLALMTWTVKTPADLEIAAAHADAAVFEGLPPDRVREKMSATK